MPAKIISEIPLPTPRSVICSPSHIRNIVPAEQGDHRRDETECPMPAIDHQTLLVISSAIEMLNCLGTTPGATVRVTCVLRNLATTPLRLLSLSLPKRRHHTTVSSCIMIDAEMYGMMPECEHREARQRATGEHIEHAEDTATLLSSRTGCFELLTGLIPGTGTCVPIRYTTISAITKNTNRRFKVARSLTRFRC